VYKYNYLETIKIAQIQAIGGEPKKPTSFNIVIEGAGTWTLECDNVQEKVAWVESIKASIDNIRRLPDANKPPAM